MHGYKHKLLKTLTFSPVKHILKPNEVAACNIFTIKTMITLHPLGEGS